MSILLKYAVCLAILAISLMVKGQPDPNFLEKISTRESAQWLKVSAFREPADASLYDLVYQRMEWETDPGVKYIKGKITSYFKIIAPATVQIVFDLKDNMQVDSILQRNSRLSFQHSANKLTIMLTNVTNPGTTDSLTVFYQGQPIESGFGSYVTALHQMTPVMWTLSEPYGAMEWWPCKQTLADKIDSIDVIVATPLQYRTASNGILIDERTSGNKRVMHWRHRYPIATYLVAIAVTNYVDYTDTLTLDDGKTVPIVNFVYPESLSYARSKTPVTTQLIRLFNQLFGMYPFSREKYGHAQFGWGGGMEHQTMSFMTNFEFELVAHELAHSWFGNAITLASWHDIWLNEGFATFATGMAWEALQGKENGRKWLNNNLSNVVSITNGSVYVADTTNVNRIFSGRLSYAKGGYLLRMLRWKLGDEVFFRAIRNYFADSSLIYGFATQQKLVAHLEAAAGESLTEFFNDWYYGEGFPFYSAVFEYTGGKKLVVLLSQRSSHSSVPFFEMPVPVRAYSAGRRDSIDLRLNHQFNDQVFEREVPFPVEELVIDPDLWLIRKIESVKVSAKDLPLSQLNLYPNPFYTSFRLDLPSEESVEKVEIFDQSGRLIWHHIPELNNLLTPPIPGGTYMLKVTTSDGIYRKQIIKQH